MNACDLIARIDIVASQPIGPGRRHVQQIALVERGAPCVVLLCVTPTPRDTFVISRSQQQVLTIRFVHQATGCSNYVTKQCHVETVSMTTEKDLKHIQGELQSCLLSSRARAVTA